MSLTLQQVVRAKTVMITGASSGIGKAAALKIGAAGAAVLLIARRKELLDEACYEITSAGGVAHAYVCDLADPEDVDRMAALVLREHGRVDILVNNAGRSIRREIAGSYDRFHDFQRTMALNYFGPVKLILNLLPVMRERRDGHIINISTAGVQFSSPMFSAYLASKAALDAFSRSISYEVEGDGVAITQVCMPLVRTAMAAPTRMYDNVPALSAEEAADLVTDAICRRPARVAPVFGTLAQVAYAVAPGLDHKVNAAVSKAFFGTPWRNLGLRYGATGERPVVEDSGLREAFRRRLEHGDVPADPHEVERLVPVLRRIPLFEACSSEELRQLAATAYPIVFEEGEDICVEGAESSDCYVVVDGRAVVTVGGAPAGEVRADEVVGERGPIEGKSRAATVTAATRLMAYAISRDRLERLLAENPKVARHMRRLVHARYVPDSER